MAHFAELDANNVVLQVVVVANKDTADANGVETEHIGAAYLERLLGGTWVQTSYNGNIRKNYAGIGYTYDADIDAFVPPKPYPSWVLNDAAQWEAPVPMPDDGQMYSWDEDSLSWIDADIDAFVPPKPYPSWVLNDAAQWEAPVPMPDDGEMYSWDEDSQSWVASSDSLTI